MYFLSRLPLDFLLSSVFSFAVVGMSILFIFTYEMMNPIQYFKDAVLALVSRGAFLVGLVALYSSFMSRHQFQIPLFDSQVTLAFSALSLLAMIQINFYLVFLEPKVKGWMDIRNNFILFGVALFSSVHFPESSFFYVFMGIAFITTIYNSVRAIMLSTEKSYAIVHTIFSILLLVSFCFSIGYIYGYTFNLFLLRFINEYSAIIFFVQVICMFLYFSYADKSTTYVFSKNINKNLKKNKLFISKNDILEKRLSLW